MLTQADEVWHRKKCLPLLINTVFIFTFLCYPCHQQSRTLIYSSSKKKGHLLKEQLRLMRQGRKKRLKHWMWQLSFIFSFKDRSHECHLFNDKRFFSAQAVALPLLTAVSSHPWRRTNRYTKPRLWAKSLNIKRKESQKFLSLFL